MALTLEQIEDLHNRGLVPDWAYYQQNGKDANHNWEEQRKKILDAIMERESQKQLNEEIEKKAMAAAEKALTELFKDFF